jgi:asparagine synthase (glutamine-hydrolysing)
MCGIAGFLSDSQKFRDPASVVRAMGDALSHRGPDASAIWTSNGIALAHARLSIIDVATGQQPMQSLDGDIHITFNGEIFNYIELRRDLIERGHRFRTESDTEVILELYRARGLDFVEDLNGDFALGLWDGARRRLVLARDRMGVRPLHYLQASSGLFFASEVKSLLAVPGIEAKLDPIALDQIFTTWAPIAPRTPFLGIEELPPGHMLVAEPSGTRVRQYWSLRFPDASEDRPVGTQEEARLAEELRALLEDATEIRLRSDVPVGSYLSGGLDSSIVAALARRRVRKQLRTFSVRFESAEFDETREQEEMAAALGTDHSAILCRTRDISQVFPDVVRSAERPILRTAPAPLFLLARLVRDKGYKVVLTGEGADEVFAGYDIFKEVKVRHFCHRVPGSAFRPLLLQRLYPYLPGMRGQPQKYLESFFGRDDITDPLASHMPRFRTTAGAKAMLSQDMLDACRGYDPLAELRDGLPADFRRWHPVSQAQYLETRHLLPGYILASQGDRMAMAHGVEGRFPFLDHRVVECAAALPPSLKLKALREKHILRESMKGIVPDSIRARTKQPYRAPDSESFLAPDAPRYVSDQLSRDAIRRSGYFDPEAVSKLVAKCQAGRFVGFRQNMAFVGVLSTQLWHDSFVTGEAQSRAA